MAVALDAVAAGSTLSSATIALTLVTSGDDRLIVGAVSRAGATGGGTVISVTYAGAALTKLGAVQSGTGNTNRGLEVYYLANPASGTNNGTFTMSSSSAPYIAGFVSFTGVDQTTPILSAGSQQATSGTIVKGTVTSSVSDMILDFISLRGANTGTVPAAQTKNYLGSAPSPGTNAQGASSRMDGAALGTTQWTFASDNFAYFSMDVAASGTSVAAGPITYKALMGVGQA